MRVAIVCVLIALQAICLAQTDVRAFNRILDSGDKASARQVVRSWFDGKALRDGASKQQGLFTAWAVQPPADSRKVEVVSDIGRFRLGLADLGEGVFAAVAELPPGTALRWRVEADGVRVSAEKQLEAYPIDVDNLPQPGVPKGELRKMPNFKSKIFAGTDREWWIYIPAGYDSAKPLPVMIFQDGQWSKNYSTTPLDNLIAKREIPKIAAVFITPGTFADGKSNRSFEYDTLSDQYSRFLLEEILPEVDKVVKLRTDAESRAIAGVSSGGICAFTAAWQRPDQFRRVMSWVGSFTNIAMGDSKQDGGHNYQALVRALPKKPIRVFLQGGENDLDNRFGSWWLANLEMDRALAFSGYDYKFVPGKGFHSDFHGQSLMPQALRWLWRPL